MLNDYARLPVTQLQEYECRIPPGFPCIYQEHVYIQGAYIHRRSIYKEHTSIRAEGTDPRGGGGGGGGGREAGGGALPGAGGAPREGKWGERGGGGGGRGGGGGGG